jgi:hypothetical protein
MHTLCSSIAALAIAATATACVAPEAGDTQPDESSQSADLTEHPNTAFTLTVSAIENETKVVRSDGNTDLCDGTCTFAYVAGLTLTISPTSLQQRADCLMWIGWNGACAGQGSTCVLTINSNLSTSSRWGRISNCRPQ